MKERNAKRARCEPATSAASPGNAHDSVSSFLKSWAWKREHRPDRDRFERPYLHRMAMPGGAKDGAGSAVKLTVEQARFRGAQGFASTVWDSSIVVSKMLERNPALVAGRRVLDLSAGCGLVALVAARLGAARTVATDLGPNLPLLRRNCERNGAAVEVLEHWWGTDTSPLLTGRVAAPQPAVTTTAAAAAAAAAPAAVPTTTTAAAGSTAAGSTAAVIAPTKGSTATGGGRRRRRRHGGEQGGTGLQGDGPRREEESEAGSAPEGPPAAGWRQGPGDCIDLVIACDVMYQEEVVGALVATLASLCGGKYDSGKCERPGANDGGTCDGGAADAQVGPPRTGRSMEGGGAPSNPPSSKSGPAAPPPPAGAAGAAGAAPGDASVGGSVPLEYRSPLVPVCDGGAAPSGDSGAGYSATTVILAHGRNRFAEAAFWRHAAAAGFTAEPVAWDELDPVYRCSDVDVYRLRLRERSS